MSQSATTKEIPNETVVDMPKPVQRYFETLNAKAFEQTVALFAADGQMFPPFDKPIVGREAIAQYLTKEASDMTFSPMHCEPTDAEFAEAFMVKGKVKNSLFAVNVSWLFGLDRAGNIEAVKIKLLAKLEELMKLNR